MSRNDPKNRHAYREKQRLAARMERRIEKRERRIRQLEHRHEELLAEKRELQAKVDTIHDLEVLISDLQGGYRLVVDDVEGGVLVTIVRARVVVWSSGPHPRLKPRHMRRARRVLAAFERSEP